MANNVNISEIERQVQRVIRALSNYAKSAESVNNIVGPTAAKGLGITVRLLWTQLRKGLRGSTKKLISSLKDASILASLDLCSILNTQRNLKNFNSGFNPNQTPPPDDTEWRIKKLAYDTQIIIDAFQLSYSTVASPGKALMALLAEIQPNIARLSSTSYLGAQEIRGKYPQVDQFSNFLSDWAAKYANVDNIPDSDKKKQDKIIATLDKLRKVCVSIQSVSIAGESIALAIKLLSELKLNEVDPDKLILKLSSTIKFCSELNRILSNIIKVLDDVQVIVRLLLILIKIFRILVSFFEVLPIPSVFTTTGVVTFLTRKADQLDKYAKDTIALLNELNLLFGILIATMDGLTDGIDSLITILQQIIEKLRSCERGTNGEDNQPYTPGLDSLESQITQLKSNNDSLKAFVANYNNNKTNTNNTYHGYTIVIEKEYIFDQELRKVIRPRRYGVALDGSGVAVVESTLTYASDDSIIINEVKLLLESKGLIKSSASVYNQYETSVINEAQNMLQDSNIVMDDVAVPDPNQYIDSSLNENENDGTGLNAFLNKLKGGKDLRKRVKSIMQAQKEKLNSDISNTKNN